MSNRTKTRFWLASICVVQIAVIAIDLSNRASGDEAAPVELQVVEPPQRLRLTTVPVAYRPIDDFIDRTRAYPDEEALAAGLNDGGDIVFLVGRLNNPPEYQFAIALADRRVARLYTMWKDAGPREASRRAAKLVDQKLKIHVEGLDNLLLIARRHLGGQPIGDEGAAMGMACTRNSHALSGALLLCAAFCDLQTVLAKIDQWEQAVGPQVDAVVLNPQLNEWNVTHKWHGRPERLYLLNLYAFLLERHAGLSAQDMLRRVKLQIDGPELFQERVAFCTWDRRAPPVAADDVLLEFSFARSWRYLESDEPRQQELLRQVRALLEEVAMPVARTR